MSIGNIDCLQTAGGLGGLHQDLPVFSFNLKYINLLKKIKCNNY